MLRQAHGSPKLARLKALLGVPRFQAVGLLECLWHFTATQAPRGDVGKWSDGEIAAALEWTGDPTALIEALVGSRLLDRCAKPHRLLVHDWAQHADQTVKRSPQVRDLGFAQAIFTSEALASDASVTSDSLVKNMGSASVATQPDPDPGPDPCPEPCPAPALSDSLVKSVARQRRRRVPDAFTREEVNALPESFFEQLVADRHDLATSPTKARAWLRDTVPAIRLASEKRTLEGKKPYVSLRLVAAEWWLRRSWQEIAAAVERDSLAGARADAQRARASPDEPPAELSGGLFSVTPAQEATT